MKRESIFFTLGFGLLSLTGIMFGATHTGMTMIANAEPEEGDPVADPVDPAPVEDPVEEPIEVFECSVVIAEVKHGEITVDKLEGHVGDIVTVNAKHDIFYLIKSVSVNGTALIEDEEISGKFAFALIEGENKIEAEFVIDQELLGEMSIIMDQALSKDWTNLFSVENVVRIITFILNGGILLAIARYFIKDKKLEKKVENKIEEVVQKIVPNSTKEIVISNFKEVILPYFTNLLTELNVKIEDIENALTVFSRCMALSVENTPEAKIAITKELSSLKLSDQASISEVEERIKNFIAEQTEHMGLLIQKMDEIEAINKGIIASASEPSQEQAVIVPASEESPKDDGTQI